MTMWQELNLGSVKGFYKTDLDDKRPCVVALPQEASEEVQSVILRELSSRYGCVLTCENISLLTEERIFGYVVYKLVTAEPAPDFTP